VAELSVQVFYFGAPCGLHEDFSRRPIPTAQHPAYS